MHHTTSIDRELLEIYLTDHLAGATGMLNRLERMKAESSDLPIHEEVTRLTSEIRQERARLIGFIRTLGLSRRRTMEALAKVAELAGRLKLNGRVLSRSPLNPLLELELLRAGINGKLALWETLGALAADLDLDSEEFATLAGQAREQIERVTRCHATMAETAFVRSHATAPRTATQPTPSA